ncbi:hypothetical protein B0T24DRAFT_600105 [Lasiosphaeria ovina]|uniref:Uncharacterized protein n=1 Tax=Lasiosphaeria ovina TaxID=92902 RepID=A0AAE0MXZ4_9PEZI|nr:hypothetical protein B0T24DRAFT_600105 [Lasiosphaeria ovina]
MARLQMIIIMIIAAFAPVLSSISAEAGIGINQFLREVTDILHLIEDNVRPPFPTVWFQVTLVLALVWMIGPLAINVWDAITRQSKRITDAPEAAGNYSWIHTAIQGFDQFLSLFRDRTAAAERDTVIAAARTERDAAVQNTQDERDVAVQNAKDERDNAIAQKKTADFDKDSANNERDAAKKSKQAADAAKSSAENKLQKLSQKFEEVQEKLKTAEMRIEIYKAAAEDKDKRAEETEKRLQCVEGLLKKVMEEVATIVADRARSTSDDFGLFALYRRLIDLLLGTTGPNEAKESICIVRVSFGLVINAEFIEGFDQCACWCIAVKVFVA